MNDTESRLSALDVASDNAEQPVFLQALYDEQQRLRELLRRHALEQHALRTRQWEECARVTAERRSVLRSAAPLSRGFWARVLRAHPVTRAVVHEEDEAALELLEDVSVAQEPDVLGFRLLFHFRSGAAENAYFADAVLEKVYRFAPEDGSLASIGGTDIQWRTAAAPPASFRNGAGFFAWIARPAFQALLESSDGHCDDAALAEAYRSDLEVGEALRDDIALDPLRWYLEWLDEEEESDGSGGSSNHHHHHNNNNSNKGHRC